MRGPDDDSVATLASRLVEQAGAVAQAEVALVKARVHERLSAFRNAGILFAVAGVFALAAFIAILVEAIAWLAVAVGHGFAILIALVVTALVVGTLAAVGKRKLAAPKADIVR